MTGRVVDRRSSASGRVAKVSEYDPSPAAVRPLMKTFWSSAGWVLPPAWPDSEQFVAAVGHGVMFNDHLRFSHDEGVEIVRTAVRALDPASVGAAFAASLSTHRLDLRSALGSFAVARHLPTHVYRAGSNYACAVCGLAPDTDQDKNVLSFERFKWGGVRRDHLAYVAFDLEQFPKAPPFAPTEEDVRLLLQLLELLAQAPATSTAVQLAPQITFIRANKAEREALLEILAVAGVLETPTHSGYRASFVPVTSRKDTGRHFEDRFYPLPWWRGSDGVNKAAIEEWFPFLP